MNEHNMFFAYLIELSIATKKCKDTDTSVCASEFLQLLFKETSYENNQFIMTFKII